MNAPCLSFRCPLRWSDLAGEGDTRHCSRCDQPVHDLSSMQPEAIVAILQRPEPSCVRFLRGASGVLVLGASLASGSALAGEGYGGQALPGHGSIGPSEPVEAVMGAIDRNIYGEAMAGLSPQLSLLWAESEAFAAGQRGKVVVRLSVGREGEVESASIQSSQLEDAAFEEAILALVLGLELPTGHGAVLLVYPLNFEAKGDEED